MGARKRREFAGDIHVHRNAADGEPERHGSNLARLEHETKIPIRKAVSASGEPILTGTHIRKREASARVGHCCGRRASGDRRERCCALRENRAVGVCDEVAADHGLALSPQGRDAGDARDHDLDDQRLCTHASS